MAEDRNEHIVDNINSLIQGPLANLNITKEGALMKIRALYQTETGYSDELVTALPSFQEKFVRTMPVPPAPQIEPADPSKK